MQPRDGERIQHICFFFIVPFMRPSRALLQFTVGRLPTKWLQAVEKLAPATILHMSLGGAESKRDQRYAAWKGDKLLGAAAVKVLEQNSKATNDMLVGASEEEHGAGAVSVLTSTAFSNSFLADNVEHILPVYAQQDKQQQLNDHQVGTMIEAAVAKIHDTDEAAVLDLVAWLLKKASNSNTKGTVLEMGGVVTCTQIGGFDHSPSFQANATLEGFSAVATASTKKKAEKLAAARLLEEMDIDVMTFEENSATILSLENKSSGEWNKVVTDTMELHLSNDECLEDWWVRGALDPQKSFHRAMMAPLVFPKCIVAVDFWTRKPTLESTEEMSAAFILITSSNSKSNDDEDGSKQDIGHQYHLTPVSQGSSNTRARKKTSLEANKIIAEIASIELPSGLLTDL